MPQLLFIAQRQTGDRRPLVAHAQNFTHFVQKFRVRVIVPPAASVAEFEEVRLATFHQCEPSARDTVVPTVLRCRHGRARSAREFGASK